MTCFYATRAALQSTLSVIVSENLEKSRTGDPACWSLKVDLTRRIDSQIPKSFEPLASNLAGWHETAWTETNLKHVL